MTWTVFVHLFWLDSNPVPKSQMKHPERKYNQKRKRDILIFENTPYRLCYGRVAKYLKVDSKRSLSLFCIVGDDEEKKQGGNAMDNALAHCDSGNMPRHEKGN